MKKKSILYIVLLACLVIIGAICIYMAVRPDGKKPDDSDDNQIETEMMHGEDSVDDNNSEDADDSQQGSSTEWDEDEQQTGQKQEQENKPEQDKSEDKKDDGDVSDNDKEPQPNTEKGWGPIT